MYIYINILVILKKRKERTLLNHIMIQQKIQLFPIECNITNDSNGLRKDDGTYYYSSIYEKPADVYYIERNDVGLFTGVMNCTSNYNDSLLEYYSRYQRGGTSRITLQSKAQCIKIEHSDV